MDLVICIRVRPSSRAPRVGGSTASRLIVAVATAAVDGKATLAATKALADALGVKNNELKLIKGNHFRDKDYVFKANDQDRSQLVKSRLETLMQNN